MTDDLPWFRPPNPRPGHCVVIGGGIAGCSIAYALDQQGLNVTLFEQHEPASGASANERAVLRPHLVRQGQQLNQFNESAFAHCLDLLTTLAKTTHPVEHELQGVLHLIDNITDWPEFASTYPVDAKEASRLANATLEAGALFTPSGGWVNMVTYCHSLLNACQQVELRSNCRVAHILPLNSDVHADPSSSEDPAAPAWQINYQTDKTGLTHSMTADNVIIANGPALQQFKQTRDLPVIISSGQTTRCLATASLPAKVITGKRYLINDSTHCTLGATHHRVAGADAIHGINTDEENAANLAATSVLTPTMNGQWQIVDHWHGYRAATPDRLPLVGPVPDADWYKKYYMSLRHVPRHQEWAPARYQTGLYVLAGLGSRGVVTSALAARLLGEMIGGIQNNSALSFTGLLHPARFLIRTLQRSRTEINQ